MYRGFAQKMMMNYWDNIYIHYKTVAMQSQSDELFTLCTEIEEIPRVVVIEMIRMIVMQSLKHCWLNYFKARLATADSVNGRLGKNVVDTVEINLQIHKFEQMFVDGARKKGKYMISQETKMIGRLNLKEFLIFDLDRNYEHN